MTAKVISNPLTRKHVVTD